VEADGVVDDERVGEHGERLGRCAAQGGEPGLLRRRLAASLLPMVGMPMATTEKLSVALGTDELAWVRKRAKRLRASVSSVITEAVRQAKQIEARRDVLDWLLEDQPAIKSAERKRVEREWKA
jgi:hypothetical protein